MRNREEHMSVEVISPGGLGIFSQKLPSLAEDDKLVLDTNELRPLMVYKAGPYIPIPPDFQKTNRKSPSSELTYKKYISSNSIDIFYSHYHVEATQEGNRFTLFKEKSQKQEIPEGVYNYVVVLQGNRLQLRMGKMGHFYISDKGEAGPVVAAGEIHFEKGLVTKINEASGSYHFDICSLLAWHAPLSVADLKDLPVITPTAYVRTDDALYFIDKENNECTLLANIPPQMLTLFDVEFGVNGLVSPNAYKGLSVQDLKRIATLTGHDRSKELIARYNERVQSSRAALSAFSFLPMAEKFEPYVIDDLRAQEMKVSPAPTLCRGFFDTIPTQMSHARRQSYSLLEPAFPLQKLAVI